jgi:hypothetical protein
VTAQSPAPAGPGRRRPPAVDQLLVATAALLSGLLTWTAGRRGFFAFDQSILFDGGWRVLSGQVPFRDFVAPVGPGSFWFQGAGFALFGADWGGYLASAAVLAAAAVAAAWIVARQALGGGRWTPLLAAAVTAVWFVPPSGTPWIDAVAFLPALLASAAMLRAAGGPGEEGGERAVGGRRVDVRMLAAGAAGALTVTVFLTKQNAALAVLPALAAAWAVPERSAGAAAHRRRLAFAFLLGAAAAAAIFAAWLAAAAEPALFVRHVLVLPAVAGGERFAGEPARLLLTLLTGAGPPAARLPLLAAAAAAVAGLARRRLRRPAAQAVALFGGQNLFVASANNQPVIAQPFSGLVLALGAYVGWELLAGAVPGRAAAAGLRRRLAAAAVALGVLSSAAAALDAAVSRRAHDLFSPGTRFVRPLAVAAWRPLLWAQPTLLREGWPDAAEGAAAEVTAADVEALLVFLERRGEPFFVFPDWTALYGLTGAPSPQPLLWFHPGLTYPRGGDPRLDRWIVAELERRRVAVVVLEEVSWLGTRRRLAEFPRLGRWIERCFRPAGRIGPFLLRERPPPEVACPPAAAPEATPPPASAPAPRCGSSAAPCRRRPRSCRRRW